MERAGVLVRFSAVFIWAIFDANNETWHDKTFGTQVVRA